MQALALTTLETGNMILIGDITTWLETGIQFDFMHPIHQSEHLVRSH